MTRNLDTVAKSAGDRSRSRAYQLDFWPGMLGYGLVLAVVLRWGRLDASSDWRFVWAVLPVLPALLMVRAVMRHITRIDDYQRLLLLRGLAVGFGVAMVTALTMGFLGIAGLPMRASGWVVYSAGMAGWALTSVVRRDR